MSDDNKNKSNQSPNSKGGDDIVDLVDEVIDLEKGLGGGKSTVEDEVRSDESGQSFDLSKFKDDVLDSTGEVLDFEEVEKEINDRKKAKEASKKEEKKSKKGSFSFLRKVKSKSPNKESDKEEKAPKKSKDPKPEGDSGSSKKNLVSDAIAKATSSKRNMAISGGIGLGFFVVAGSVLFSGGSSTPTPEHLEPKKQQENYFIAGEDAKEKANSKNAEQENFKPIKRETSDFVIEEDIRKELAPQLAEQERLNQIEKDKRSLEKDIELAKILGVGGASGVPVLQDKNPESIDLEGELDSIISSEVGNDKLNKVVEKNEVPKPSEEPAREKNLNNEVIDKVSNELSRAIEIVSMADKESSKTISNLENKFEYLVDEFTKMSALNSQIMARLQSQNELIKSQSEKISKIKSDQQTKEALIAGRERIKGYHITDVTSSGEKSVVEVIRPNRTSSSVLFEGEHVVVGNKGTYTVKGIHDNGNLVLIGNKFYVDRVLEPVIEEDTDSGEEISFDKMDVAKQLMSIEKGIATDAAINASAKFIAKGWTLNGYFGDKFFIVTSDGRWINHTIGDRIDGFGIVQGLDKEDNLIVGDYVIKQPKVIN